MHKPGVGHQVHRLPFLNKMQVFTCHELNMFPCKEAIDDLCEVNITQATIDL